MKKAQVGFLAEKGASSTMKKGGDGCDGCRSSTSASGNGNETRSARKAAATDDLKKVGEGDAGTSSTDNSSCVAPPSTRVTRSATATAAATTGATAAATTGATAAATTGATAAAVTAARTSAGGDAEADEDGGLAGAAAESKESDREEEVKDGEGGQARSGGGSNRAQRTCRRLALKRIRQYVGYIEEGASTPTAPDSRSVEERSLFKEGRNLTATPSTASTAVRSSTSSRARRGGSVAVETVNAATAGTRHRARTPALPEHSSCSSKHASRSKGEKEAEEDGNVASGCTSPLGRGNGNEDILSCTTPVSKSEAGAAAASAAGTRKEAGADKMSSPNASESPGTVLTGADDSIASVGRSAAPSSGNDAPSCNSGSGGNSSSSGAGCPLWNVEEGVAAAPETAGHGKTACGSSGRPSNGDVASDSGLRVREDGGGPDGAAASPVASTPEPSPVAAGTATRLSAGGVDCALTRRSNTLLRAGSTTDADLRGHCRWQQQQRSAQQHRIEVGKIIVASSDDVAGDDGRALAVGEESVRCEKDALPFSSAPAVADAGMPSPAAATTPPAATTLPSSMFLSAATLAASRPSCATGSVAFPGALVSPTTCSQQHAANLNALMVKSVSPAGVVRRGGRNRRKRTKYDLAYRQMEELGPFAEEAKAVDLSKVSGSSFAVELLKNPDLYSYEAWSHGFAWPVGADGRRLLLRKLRGVYWSDPDYWQQRLMSEGLYRRDLFTLATVQELFKVTHLMGPAVWDFLLKCTALTHKCEALTAKDSDQTDGEDGGGAAAHASSPEALSPNAGPHPVAPSAEVGICTRRVGSSSRGSLLPAAATDHQLYGGQERNVGTSSFPGDSGADGTADSEAAAAAHALAAAAGAVAEDPMDFSSWLRATTGGVTSLGAADPLLGPSTDADGLPPEGVLLMPHTGLACAGTPVREGEEGAVKGGSISRNFFSSSRQKKSFSRCPVPPAPLCESESSGLELDLSTQQMLDAVAAAVEAAAAGQASQQHASQATTLSNRTSTVDAEQAPYLPTNNDIAAVLAAARGFDTGYECPAACAAPTSPIGGCTTSKGTDSLVAADAEPAAPSVAIALSGVATNAGSDTSFEKAVAALREPAEESGTGAQRLSAAAAAAAAADWLGSLQQLLPPVLHAGARVGGGARVDEDTPETAAYGGKAAKPTSAEERTELSCPQYAPLSVLDPARTVPVSSAAGVRMADKLLELLSSPSRDKRSSTKDPAVETERTGKASAQKVADVLGCGGAPRDVVDSTSSLAKTSREETENGEAGSEARQRAQVQRQSSSAEGQEERRDENSKEDGFSAESRSRGGRALPAGVPPRTDTGSGAGGRDTNTQALSHPAFDLLLPPGEEFSVECSSSSDSSRNSGAVAVADRSRYRRDSVFAAGTAAAVPAKAKASGASTLTDDGDSPPCHLALRNMMRLMRATAATAPEVPTAAEECAPAPGSSRAAAGIESFPEVVRETSLFTSQGEASERKKTSGKKTTSSLEDPQQQEQQSRSVSSLMTTLATALEQHAAPLRIDSGADKSAEGTDAVTDENAQQVISLLQAVNQHLEKQQRKPVTSSFPRPLVSSCVPEASPGSPRATLFGGGGSPCQGLAAQVTDGVSHQTASERLGELRSHGRQEQASSSSHEEFSSGTRCTKCGGCCGEGNSICKECSRKSCPRDQPTKRRTSSSERSAPTFARTFAATSNDAITKANGDFSSARASTQRARRIGEKASLTSALERSLRDGTAALSGEVTGERALSKEERPQIGAGSTGGQDFHLEPGARGAVDVGAGRVGGSFSQKQLDVVLSRSSHHQGETRARHPERQAGSAASHTGAAAAAAELQTPTDLWMRCMQAMGSSLAFLRNCPSRTSESRRRVGSRRSSDAVLAAGGSTVGDVSARADSDACRTAAADARGEDSRNRNRLLPVRTPEAERLGMRRRGRSSRDGSVSLQSRACSSGRPTDGGSEDATNIVFPAQPGEGSGALLLRALRAYSSSAATVAETAPRLWETGSLRRGEEGKATTSDASKSSFGGGVRCSNTSSGSSIPLRGRGSFVRLPASATSSSCWRGAAPDSDGSASSSSAGPACTAAAASSAPSAASLLESTHALLQLKTHYDFMAQFMQCMMLLEVQQALVRLLQSLRRNYPSTHNSRNPSSSSLRRARRMQRRNGRKTQVSFFSSGNDSSCGSSSETGVVDRSLRNSEKFIHNRRRRRRIDAAVNGVPLDACTRLQGGGEAVSPVSRGVGEAEDLQRTSAALCLTIDDRDHQEKAESVADTDKGSMAAAPQPGSTGVACGGEVNKKDGGNSNSVHATSTCSSSAYSSVGRQRRRQSVHRRPRQPGRLDGSAPRREHRSRGSCTAGEQEKGINKSRTNSTSSGRSHSVSSLKCDDGGENVHTNSSSGSSISGNDTNRTDVLWEDEVERSRLRDSSNRSPGDADLHGDPDLSLETFSGRDATMKSCLESLIESLRVQMRFVHVMAGHLQEHMGAAATQERKLEDNSVIRQVEQSFQMGCSREEQQPSASSGSGPPPRDLDTPVATSHSSVGDTQPSSEAAVGSSDATDGGRQTVRRCAGGEESGSPGRCECGDIYYSSGGGGRTSCVRSSSSSGPDFEAAQHAFARDRTGLCERSTPRGDSSTEGRSRRQSCADNSAECRDTPEDRGSQCLKNKDSVSSNAKSDETEWNNAAVGTRAWKKRRLCEGTPGEESVKDGVENLQLSAEKRVRREAHKEAGRCVPATSKDTKTPTRTTEGERAAKFVSGEAESTLPEGTAVSRPGTSGSSYLRDPLVYPTAAGEIRSAALAAGEKVAGESLPGRSVCPTEGKANVSSAVGSSRHGRASFGGARESESYSRTSGSEYNENVFLKCEHEQRQQEILQEFSNGTNESSGSATRNACITQPSNYCPSSSANVRRSNRSGGSGSSRFGTDLGCFKIMEDKEGEGGSDGAPIVDLAASVLTVNLECHVDDAGAANAVQERMNLKADEASETLREKSARLPEPEAGETATEGEKTETKNKKREVAPATVGAGQQQQQQDGRRSTEHDVCG